MDVAHSVLCHDGECSSRTRAELVVVDQVATEFNGFAVGIASVVALGYKMLAKGISKGLGRLVGPGIVVIERDVGAEFESVETVRIPENSEISAEIMAFIAAFLVRLYE